MKLIPIKYKYFCDKKSFLYYIELEMNYKEQMKWFIKIPGSKHLDFHFANFIDFKDGFDSAENAFLELKKYIN